MGVGGGVFWPGIRYVMGGGGIIRSQKYASVPIRNVVLESFE
jgi:hypothetical protein